MKLRNGALPVASTALPAQTTAFVMKILGNASVLQVLWEKHVRKLVEPTLLAKHVKRPVKKIMAAETLCSVYQIHMAVLVPQDGWDWNVIKNANLGFMGQIANSNVIATIEEHVTDLRAASAPLDGMVHNVKKKVQQIFRLR